MLICHMAPVQPATCSFMEPVHKGLFHLCFSFKHILVSEWFIAKFVRLESNHSVSSLWLWFSGFVCMHAQNWGNYLLFEIPGLATKIWVQKKRIMFFFLLNNYTLVRRSSNSGLCIHVTCFECEIIHPELLPNCFCVSKWQVDIAGSWAEREQSLLMPSRDVSVCQDSTHINCLAFIYITFKCNGGIWVLIHNGDCLSVFNPGHGKKLNANAMEQSAVWHYN